MAHLLIETIAAPPSAYTAMQLKAQAIVRDAETAKETPVASVRPRITVSAVTTNLATVSTVVADKSYDTPDFTPLDPRVVPISTGDVPVSCRFGNCAPTFMAEANAGFAPGWGVRFMSDAEACEVVLRDGGLMAVRARVDGEWTSDADASGAFSGSYSNFYSVKYDYAVAKPRRWEFFFSSFSQIRGFNCGKAKGSTAALNPYRVWKTPTVDEPRVLVRTDSYGSTSAIDATTKNPRDPFPYWIGERLGVTSIVSMGVGGQGFVSGSNNSGAAVTAQLSDLNNYANVDLFILALGYNDDGQPEGRIRASALAYLKAVRARYPKAFIAVVGPWRTPVHDAVGPRLALQAAVKAFADPYTDFIDPIAGSTEADPTFQDTAGDNVLLYIGADRIHPNGAGGRYLGDRIATSLITWLRTQAGTSNAPTSFGSR